MLSGACRYAVMLMLICGHVYAGMRVFVCRYAGMLCGHAGMRVRVCGHAYATTTTPITMTATMITAIATTTGQR